MKTNDLLKERLNEYQTASEEVKKTKDFLLQKHERVSTVENEKIKYVLKQMKSENMTDENEENNSLQNKEEEEEEKKY